MSHRPEATFLKSIWVTGKQYDVHVQPSEDGKCYGYVTDSSGRCINDTTVGATEADFMQRVNQMIESQQNSVKPKRDA